MKTYLVNYGGDYFADSEKKLHASAKKYGIDEVLPYARKDIVGTEFYSKNKSILDRRRGAGYWLWKPFIILDAMGKIEDGDLLLYSDSGIEIIDELEPLFRLCKKNEGQMLFNIENQNKSWVKRDCFVRMDCDAPKYWKGEQAYSSFHLHMKTEKCVKVLEEWLEFCCDAKILCDEKNTCGLQNFPEFKEHRHDQSVLSLLAIKYGIKLFRDPSQFGNYLKMPEFRKEGELEGGRYAREYADEPRVDSPYGTIINHHRQSKRWQDPNYLFWRVRRSIGNRISGQS